MAEASNYKSSQDEFVPFIRTGAYKVTADENVCITCLKQGTIKMMFISIWLFREVVLTSFECQYCHYKNPEIGSATEISPQELKVKSKEDLDRLIIKTSNGSVDDVTTVEGLLRRIITGLQQDQPRRKEEQSEEYVKREACLKRVEDFIELNSPFSMIIHDTDGKSFIGRQRADPLKRLTDANLPVTKFQRTEVDNTNLGINDPSIDLDKTEEEAKPTEEPVISGVCFQCGNIYCTKMKVVDIPFFKQGLLIAIHCPHCGFKSNEVKFGKKVEPKGKKITLRVKSKEDLNRDVLNTETCNIKVPELEIGAGTATSCGKFTTVQGLILDIKEELLKNPLLNGESLHPVLKRKVAEIIGKLDALLTGEREFTVILDDPTGNSYLQNFYAPEEDPAMKIELYERTFEQNKELGLAMDVGEKANREMKE